MQLNLDEYSQWRTLITHAHNKIAVKEQKKREKSEKESNLGQSRKQMQASAILLINGER